MIPSIHDPTTSVKLERRGSALLVTIDRPDRRNAVDGPTAEALERAFERFEADDEARVLVLTGAGDEAFCAGADLKALDTLTPRFGSLGGPMGFTHRTPSKPTVAAIGGWCVAGGLELALWCDVRIATTAARFGCTERRFGVPLIDGGTHRLPRVVGLGRALDLILSGRVVDADEAERIGLVTQLVEPGTQVDAALQYAEALAGFPQATMLADRASALRAFDLDPDAHLRLESRNARDTLDDAAAGAARFAQGAGRHAGDVGPGHPA